MFETLRGKIFAIATVALLGALILGGLAIHAAQSGADRLEIVYRDAVEPLNLVQTIERDIKEVRFRMAGVALHQLPTMGSSVHLKGIMASLPERWKTFHDLASAQPFDEEGRARLEKISVGMERLNKLMAEVLVTYENDNIADLEDLLESQWPRMHGQVVKPLEQFVPIYEERAKVAFESALISSQRLTWIVITLAASTLLIVGYTYLILQQRISRQFDLAKESVEAISEFDLSRPISVVGNDEISHLLRDLVKMQTRLRETVRDVRQASDRVSMAANEISIGNKNLSSRTEQAASSLEQTAASMDELNGTVHNSTDATIQANKMASRASEIAVRGGQVVRQVVMTMEDINQGSRRISEIIGVIDEIAFQTNILALNAAVEAARAGEQGRGFAVVASEVRNLAQRSAIAAKEIKGLISASVGRVETGSHLVDEAGQTMDGIVSSIQRVTEIMTELSTAANEESDGIGQITQAVVLLDEMTQKNASLVEDSAALTHKLQDEARRLASLVAVFRVDSGFDQAVTAS